MNELAPNNRATKELNRWSDRLKTVGATPERVWAQLKSIISGDRDLATVKPERLAALAVQVYLLGLDLDPQLGQVWIRPSSRGEATLMIGFRGWIALLGKPIHCQLVYQGDDFIARFSAQTGLKVEHEMSCTGSEIIAAYAAVKIDDDLVTNVVQKAQIRKAIERGGSAWRTHPESMIRALAIRELFKLIPTNSKIQQALKIDNLNTTQL